MITAGIDIGSTTTKAVILGDTDSYSYALQSTGIEINAISRQVLKEACDKAGLKIEDLDRIVATGYGRISIPFATTTITEITCNAAGVHHLFPNASLVVDIGGQDSKVIKIDDQGRVMQFAMNDKCAAGTGKFLEVAAQTLGVPVSEIGDISMQSKNKVTISSICTVFAQTEIVSLIARQTDKEDIAAGLHESIVSRVYGLISSVNPDPQAEVVLTGGVAKNAAIVQLLERMLGRPISVPDDPQIVTALGAALLARKLQD
ncbi:ATPase, BadF/BadG/BcrA/BcrD type [Syntrophomonas zehnderi OL-4]|uniref:ATPase, BadF/BadG/BcrA/BcrD type n=1 Tax=Syntrophomonas zehnderi OL-4 TaxID=690567 RepID=A0A0E4C8F9_9FIRM|nr:acyl-CoA dehydratase activase [Syntrophomonas zehnderi]CFX42501.1 ATPase, BadF/BadG/BcrA/BcrD type [Syntrophomonas zehnderi OL-4]